MAHTAETGRVLCSFQGPLILWFSLGTSQENGKGIIPTLKAFTAEQLATGVSLELFRTCLASWLWQRHSEGSWLPLSPSPLACAWEISALLHGSVSEKKESHFKLAHRQIKICPPRAHSDFYQQAVEQYKLIYATRAVLPREVIFNFIAEVCGTRYPVLP